MSLYVDSSALAKRYVPEPESEAAEALLHAEPDQQIQVVELDAETCARAADFAVTLGVRTLDALHLAAAHRVGGGALPFLTFDLRQAQAARSLGWTVLGT